MFAVVRIGGHQYPVTNGEKLEVDLLSGAVGETLTLPEVLLVSDDGKTMVGTPYVDGVVVQAKILSHVRGEKIDIRRFRAKSRIRRSRGFRAELTSIQIESIGSGTESKPKNAARPPKAKK